MREPGSEARVAAAVGEAFGLPAQKLAARIAAGPVRVKKGADGQLARQLVSRLEGMGAACSFVEAGAAASAEPQLAPADPFAPPEMQAPPPELELAEQATVPDGEVILARAPGAEPAASAQRAGSDATVPLAPEAAQAVARAHARSPRQSALRERLADAAASSRARFVAGVVAASLAGLLAAHVVGAIREGGLEDSRERLAAAAAEVSDQASWQALNDMRASELEAMRSRRAGIAATAGVVWLAVAGGVAFLWLRVIDWPAVVRRLRPP